MPRVSYPEMAASFWCAWRAISQPLVLVLCISARSEGQLTETSPIEMTNSRYRATCVLNSWTSWKRIDFLSGTFPIWVYTNMGFQWPLSQLHKSPATDCLKIKVERWQVSLCPRRVFIFISKSGRRSCISGRPPPPPPPPRSPAPQFSFWRARAYATPRSLELDAGNSHI